MYSHASFGLFFFTEFVLLADTQPDRVKDTSDSPQAPLLSPGTGLSLTLWLRIIADRGTK